MGKKSKTLEARITELEAKVAELERCKHEDHTIGGEAVLTIAALVKADIARLLTPVPQETQEGEENGNHRQCAGPGIAQ